MYVVINEMEKDVLKEIINIGLTKAADSLASISKDEILMHVPEVRIVEPSVIPNVLSEFDKRYFVVRSDIEGDLQGKTFLLFSDNNVERVSEVCLGKEMLSGPLGGELQRSLLLEISNILTGALVTQLANIIELEIHGMPPAALFEDRKTSITEIINDLPVGQPLVITVKTEFKNLVSSVELPMLIIFNSDSLFKLLNIIRSKNLYDSKAFKIVR